MSFGFRDQGVGVRFQFRVWGLGLGVAGCWLRVQGLGSRVEGCGLRVKGLGFRA